MDTSNIHKYGSFEIPSSWGINAFDKNISSQDLLAASLSLNQLRVDPGELIRMRRTLSSQHTDLPLQHMLDTEIVAALEMRLSSGLSLFESVTSFDEDTQDKALGGSSTEALKEESGTVDDDTSIATTSSVDSISSTGESHGLLTVTVCNEKGDAIKGADIALDFSNKGVTNSNGELDLGEVTEGTYQISADKNGYEAVTITEQVTPNTCTVARITLGACQLTRVEPVEGSEAAPQKWFVNLEPDLSQKQGPEIDVVAHITPKLSGVAICFKLESGSSNIDEATLGATDRAKLVNRTITTDAGGVAKTKLKLTHCGLDKYRVVASIDGIDGSNKESGWIEVWRKLYYQQTRMKTSYSFPFTNVSGEYAKYGVQLDSSGEIVESIHKANLETADLKAYARNYHKKRKQPYEAHVLLIDRQCDSKEETLSQEQVVPAKDYLFTKEVWPFSDWKIMARWREKGDSSWITENITITKSTSKINVDLSGTGVDPTVNTIEIEVKIKLLKGEYTGDATYKPHMFIATGKPRSDASKSKTVNHEIGHGIGMVPTSRHDLQYDNQNGGMGSHCRHGATPNEASKAQGGTFTGKYSSGTCVMFAYSSSHYSFCETCAKYVKKAKMGKTDMDGRGWG